MGLLLRVAVGDCDNKYIAIAWVHLVLPSAASRLRNRSFIILNTRTISLVEKKVNRYVDAAENNKDSGGTKPVKAWSHKGNLQWSKLDYSAKGLFRMGWPETPGVAHGSETGFYRVLEMETTGLYVSVLKKMVVSLPSKQLRAHSSILEGNGSAFSWRAGGT